MTLIRWEPVREISSIQNEMNRLFNSFFDTPTPAQGNGGSVRRWIPPMDLVETEAEYLLKADLPGLSDEDVSIEFEDNVLTIAGERKSDHEERKDGYYRVERSYGRFSRSLTLPEGVDAEAVKASFDHGVLEIHVPKPEAKKPRKVEISIGETPNTIEGAETDAADAK